MAGRRTDLIPLTDGLVVPMSRKRMIGQLVMTLVGVAIGVGLVWAGWSGYELRIGVRRFIDASGIAFIGWFMIAICIGTAIYTATRYFRPDRLILGSTTFQWVVGNGHVSIQIPYRTIEEVSLLSNEFGLKSVGIRVKPKRQDPDLYVKESISSRGSVGWDVQIEDGLWALPAAELHAALLKHVESFTEPDAPE